MPKTSNKSAAKSYRELSAELSELLAWFESDSLDIDLASAKYQQALELIALMEKHLKTAQNSVKKVSVDLK